MVAMTTCKWLTVCIALETTGAACQQKQWNKKFMAKKLIHLDILAGVMNLIQVCEHLKSK